MPHLRGRVRLLVAGSCLVAVCGACSSGSESTTPTTVTGPVVSGASSGLSQTMLRDGVSVRVPSSWSTQTAPPPDNLVSSLATGGLDTVKITVVDGPFDEISAGILGDQSDQGNVNQAAISGHQAVTMNDTSTAQVVDEIIVDLGAAGTALILASGPSGDRVLLEAILATTTVS